jgi:hypothetical protein
MGDIAPEIHEESKSTVAAEPTTNSTGKLIRAKDFISCFRRNPDDLYLMRKFCLSPQQLAKVYKAIIEKGLLTEFEYHYLRGIPPVVSESRTDGPSLGEAGAKRRNPEIRGVEPRRDEIREPLMYLREPICLLAE